VPDPSPLVSVVIPVKNRVHLIRERLDSFLRQTYRHFEVLVVNDGPTDGTQESVRQIGGSDPRVRLIEREAEPGGAPVARNIGAGQALGKYVIFFDSDDLADPTCLEGRVKIMESHPDLDFAVFDMELFRERPGDLRIFLNCDTGEDDLPAVAAGCGSSPPCRIPSRCRPSSPTSAALAPPSRPAPPHPPPPRSGRLAARPDPGGVTRAGAPPGPRCRTPPPASLTASPRRRRMAQGSRAIAGPGLAFSPFSPSRRRRGASSGAGPGSQAGGVSAARRRTAFVQAMRAAQEVLRPRGQREGKRQRPRGLYRRCHALRRLADVVERLLLVAGRIPPPGAAIEERGAGSLGQRTAQDGNRVGLSVLERDQYGVALLARHPLRGPEHEIRPATRIGKHPACSQPRDGRHHHRERCGLAAVPRITGSTALPTALTLRHGVIASDLPYFREMPSPEPDAGAIAAWGSGPRWPDDWGGTSRCPRWFEG
jgi:hypothetical protein